MRGERFFAAGALFALTACGSAPSPPADELRKQFRAAAADARVVEPSEVVDDLVPLTQEVVELVWRGSGSSRQVLMVAWGESRAPGRPGRSVSLRDDLRVTPAPLLADFCRPIDAHEKELTLRLEGLLGLPPGSGRGRPVAELWVRPADLFRACPDPEVTDRACEPELSDGMPEAHRRWFEERLASSYDADQPLWTRLGYTYDWANPYGEVGLPEYIARRGAEVEVAAVMTLKRYCRRE